MKRRAAGLLPALLAVALAVGVAFAAVGDHVSSQDFDLASANGSGVGIVWDGAYLHVVDSADDKVYAYTSSGTYTSSFDLTSANGGGLGITWDGEYFRVVDPSADKVYAYTSSGTYTSSEDFDLTSANNIGGAITWDGEYFRVLDVTADKVYAYTSSGTYTSSEDFDLTSANDGSTGITWDGVYFRVTDGTDDKVYAYTSSGTYTSSEDFDLASANDASQGITWDGVYFRVTDGTDDKVYAYEGPVRSNYGLGDAEYEAGISSTVVAYGDWKCVRSQTGVSVRINNAQATIHGFCARQKGASGMEVEIHLASNATYDALSRLTDVTGHWWFIRTGAYAASFGDIDDVTVYDDTATSQGALAFREEVGGLESSDRLGFTTMAKAVEDTDCTEGSGESSGAGFTCAQLYLSTLSTDDEAVFLISLSDDNKVELADTPNVPESFTVSRSDDFTSANLQWGLYDAVTVYEIERLTAVQVNVADASRIEYGNPLRTRATGTQAGIEELEVTGLEARRTYQFRIRARGGNSTAWSDWSEYVFSGAKPQVDLQAPGNLELDRDADSIIASWTAPPDDFDNFTLQRQELIIVEGSTFFANVTTIASSSSSWLPKTSTTYTDQHILPGQTYEYRVAAVKDDQVGAYSDWFRIGPLNTSLGEAPANLRFLATGQRIFDERMEFWMGWDDIGAVDDYEVQVLSFDITTGGQSLTELIVSDPTIFQTSYGRVGLRVRGRKLDTDICSSSPDDRCLTAWTAWHEMPFTPVVTIETPDLVDDSTDTSVMTLRADVEEILEEVLEPTGATIEGERVVQFLVLVTAIVVAALSVALSWRRGMVPLGVGMGATILILILFTGYRLFGTPLAWPVAAQTLVAVAGLFALVRQAGVFR